MTEQVDGCVAVVEKHTRDHASIITLKEHMHICMKCRVSTKSGYTGVFTIYCIMLFFLPIDLFI